jgi:hypothetical protein
VLSARLSSTAAIASLLFVFASSARADSYVNCDTEGAGAFQHLLNTVPYVHGPAGAGVMHVSGTCNGQFYISGTRNFTIRGPATLDAQHRGPALQISNQGGWVILDNLTFRHGAPSAGNHGGGILIYGTEVTIKNSAIVDNRSEGWGGGVSADRVPVKIENSFIARNRAPMGGGVFVRENGADIISSILFENHADSHGGGVYSSGNQWGVDLVHTIVSSNTSNSSTPGVIAAFVDIKRSVISHNRSQAHAHGAVSGGTQVLVENSSIVDNHGGTQSIAGGVVAGHVSIKNSTVADNTGSTVGGVYASSLGATATTFTGNRSTSTEGVGGAGAIYGAGNPPNLRASILAGNHGVNPDCYSTYPVVSGGYNLVGNAKGCTWNYPAAGDRLGSAAALVNPLLGPIEHLFHASSYTSLPIFPLKTSSPAIDAIPPAACPFAHDQLGQSRPSGAGCDIGAFEKHPGH